MENLAENNYASQAKPSQAKPSSNGCIAGYSLIFRHPRFVRGAKATGADIIGRMRSPHEAGVTGFTLIELSIVLVIIGLVVGGVLVGKDLIQAAEARAQMKQFQDIEAALYTFRLKYNCMAGDCKNASQFGLGSNGDGNGLLDKKQSGTICNSIDYADASCAANKPSANNSGIFMLHDFETVSETNQFWVHLGNAKLISGTFRETTLADTETTLNNSIAELVPKAASGKTYLTAFAYNGKNYIRTGLTGFNGASVTFTDGAMNGSQANMITSKISDGSIEDVVAPNKKVFPVIVRQVIGLGAEFILQRPSANPNYNDTDCFNYTPTTYVPITYNFIGKCNMVYQLD